jgi:hypothetical protein
MSSTATAPSADDPLSQKPASTPILNDGPGQTSPPASINTQFKAHRHRNAELTVIYARLLHDPGLTERTERLCEQPPSATTVSDGPNRALFASPYLLANPDRAVRPAPPGLGGAESSG